LAPSHSRNRNHVEHLRLLRLARDAQRAAATGDQEAVHAALCEVRNELVVHLRHERCGRRPGGDLHARLIAHGQDRIRRFIDRLLADPDECFCVVRAAELRAMLIRQIRLEGGLRQPRG